MSVDDDMLRQWVNRRIAEVFCFKLGHHWEEDRINRIADDAAEMIAEGIPSGWAFATAYSQELIMYGDGSIINPIGLLKTH